MSTPLSGQQQKRICVANDSEIVLKTLKSFLTDLGYEVITLKSSDLAKENLDNTLSRVNFAILPLSFGKRLIWKISQVNPSPKIVLVRDSKTRLKASEAMDYGVYAYLRQPIHLDELELILGRL